MPRFSKGSQEAKDHMAALRAMRGCARGGRVPVPRPVIEPIAQPPVIPPMDWEEEFDNGPPAPPPTPVGEGKAKLSKKDIDLLHARKAEKGDLFGSKYRARKRKYNKKQ